MQHSNRSSRTERFMQKPSFSATLLDKIYRSIDEPEAEKIKKQSSRTAKDPRTKQNTHRHNNEELFCSSNSSSSDYSSVGFSSSDAESINGGKPRAMKSFLPPPPKPVRTTLPSRSEKCKRTDEKQRTVFHEQRRGSPPLFDNYSHSQRFSTAKEIHDEGIIKSKSRALRIYANLKKAKTPISPGGRLASFINSLFTPGNLKKSKNPTTIHSFDDRSYPPSNCSSASSFSRSCLSTKSPGSRNAPKRSVRFYPVSVILDEDLKPCGHKSLSEDSGRVLQSGRSCVRNDFLRDYLRNQKKNSSIDNYGVDDDEDDASSCSSSDLFELDHLDVMRKDGRYCEELPVYETTHFRVR